MLWHTSGAYLPLIDDFPSRSHVQLFVTPWTTAHQASVILVAGKGHEDYQVLGDTKIHFDDKEVIAEAFAEMN